MPTLISNISWDHRRKKSRDNRQSYKKPGGQTDRNKKDRRGKKRGREVKEKIFLVNNGTVDNNNLNSIPDINIKNPKTERPKKRSQYCNIAL